MPTWSEIGVGLVAIVGSLGLGLVLGGCGGDEDGSSPQKRTSVVDEYGRECVLICEPDHFCICDGTEERDPEEADCDALGSWLSVSVSTAGSEPPYEVSLCDWCDASGLACGRLACEADADCQAFHDDTTNFCEGGYCMAWANRQYP